ncbi:hypothetical protein ASPBRDRAFT_673962 [Aspergillus brasiliensis CBS 101740]|uniref:Uncharacterized protein n=1 Tax=Aspergillus brasiliensis (strain CBS 101740 / IMI 381727 / IBT 21946) TaxID=767769 RepID=A0A1L9UIV2_ASPBC|nr:hypothetical protein ASPBRDRAFT_673962 [Aspergillus brasiliensis CBS 101740]
MGGMARESVNLPRSNSEVRQSLMVTRAGTPHEIQTLAGHATIPPTSWALTNGYFHRRCRAEATPGIILPGLAQKVGAKLRGKGRGEER